MHVSKLLEHPGGNRDVAGSRRGDLVVSLADQFVAVISEEFAKIVRNPNISSITVNNCGVNGCNARFRRSTDFQIVLEAFHNPFGHLVWDIGNDARWGITLLVHRGDLCSGAGGIKI